MQEYKERNGCHTHYRKNNQCIQYIINQNIMTLKEIYKKEKGMTILNITTVLVGIL